MTTRLAPLVIDGIRATRLRMDELPKYVSSPRAGWSAYLEYCRWTLGEEVLQDKLDELSDAIEEGVESVQELMDELKKNQKDLNTARADKKRYERLIADGPEVDPKDLAIYAQEFDSIANLEGVTEIGVNAHDVLFVIFKPRLKLKNRKWCDFGDWRIEPTSNGSYGYGGNPICLRQGTTCVSRQRNYPHHLTHFCWGHANGDMGSNVTSGRYFELLSHASQALMTFYDSEETCSDYFHQLQADDRPKEVKVDPAARQLYIDAKVSVSSDHAEALEEVCDTIKECLEEIEEISTELKTEREKLAQLRKEATVVKRKLAAKAGPEVLWRQEFDEILALPEVLAVRVYEYGDRQCLKFVVRLTHKTPKATYYLGDYEIDFLLYNHGHSLRVERLKTGLNPRAERGEFGYTIHHFQPANLETVDIRRFDVNKGDMLEKLRAIIRHLSTPDDDNEGAVKYYYVLWKANKK